MSLKNLTSVTVVGCLLVAACKDDNGFFRDPDTETIRATLKTAVPLAHYAVISMAAVRGVDLTGVSTTNTCVEFPCPAIVSIDTDSQSLLFVGATGGTVEVAGLWTEPNRAVLTVVFVNTRIGVPSFPVSKIASVPVVGTDDPNDGYTIVYANVDVNVGSEPDDNIPLSDNEIRAEYDRLDVEVSDDAEVNVGMDAWLISHTDGGTRYDFSDDSYTISGGGQYVNVASSSSGGWTGMIQLGMVGVTVSHECAANPTSGLAVIQEAGTSGGGMVPTPVLGQATILCESTCNGSVRVLISTGNYVGAVGSTVPLNLNQP